MLVKCIVKPISGEISVGGKRIEKDCDFPQNTGIIIETSGYKNLKIISGLRRKISRDDIHRTMRQVGLAPDLKRHVRKYSLGMRQRLGLLNNM